MDFNRQTAQKYIGKHIILFPNDTYTKHRIIKDVDEFGWTFEDCDENGKPFKYAKSNLTFYSHSHHTLSFEILN